MAGRGSLEVAFAEGDTVLLVTDGLVERRGEDIETGLARLRRATRLLAAASLDDGLGEVVSLVGDDSSDDDVAALSLRRAAGSPSRRGPGRRAGPDERLSPGCAPPQDGSGAAGSRTRTRTRRPAILSRYLGYPTYTSRARARTCSRSGGLASRATTSTLAPRYATLARG